MGTGRAGRARARAGGTRASRRQRRCPRRARGRQRRVLASPRPHRLRQLRRRTARAGTGKARRPRCSERYELHALAQTRRLWALLVSSLFSPAFFPDPDNARIYYHHRRSTFNVHVASASLSRSALAHLQHYPYPSLSFYIHSTSPTRRRRTCGARPLPHRVYFLVSSIHSSQQWEHPTLHFLFLRPSRPRNTDYLMYDDDQRIVYV